jgi:hypothetical protein
VLRFLRGLGDAAVCVLGNHDLHLLALAEGYSRAHKGDTLDAVLAAPAEAGLARGQLADGARRGAAGLERG